MLPIIMGGVGAMVKRISEVLDSRFDPNDWIGGNG